MADECCKSSALQGNRRPQSRSAHCLENGLCAVRDRTKAAQYHELSVNQGPERAREEFWPCLELDSSLWAKRLISFPWRMAWNGMTGRSGPGHRLGRRARARTTTKWRISDGPDAKRLSIHHISSRIVHWLDKHMKKQTNQNARLDAVSARIATYDRSMNILTRSVRSMRRPMPPRKGAFQLSPNGPLRRPSPFAPSFRFGWTEPSMSDTLLHPNRWDVSRGATVLRTIQWINNITNRGEKYAFQWYRLRRLWSSLQRKQQWKQFGSVKKYGIERIRWTGSLGSRAPRSHLTPTDESDRKQ